MSIETDVAMPTVFLAHGSPMLLLTETPANRFLQGLARSLPKPRGIVVLSPHWETDGLRVSAPGPLRTIHDFRGFPRALYEMDYPARAESGLVSEVLDLLKAAGRPAALDSGWGLDHGAWVPLSLAYPEADIPVVALSQPLDSTPESLFRLGQALAPLRQKGILLAASGMTTHNLYAIERDKPETLSADWVVEFDAWLDEGLKGGEIAYFDDLEKAPHFRTAHPTEEHLLPIFFALGAAGPNAAPELLHRSYEYGTLSMSYYRFAA